MTSHERVFAVSVATHYFFGKWPRITYIPAYGQKVTVDKPCIPLLKDRIEELQNLPTDQLIITIDYQENLLRPAEMFGRHTQIWHGPHLMWIYDQFEPFSRDFCLVLHEKADLITSTISRGIINEDYMVIGIILHEYTAHIFEMALFGYIVVTGHHHTER